MNEIAKDLTERVQILRDGEGHPTFAVVPFEDWDRILADLEDRLDAARADRVLARIAAGEETIPGAVVHAIHVEHKSPLAAFRRWRGLKQVQLAQASGLNQAYISQIEAGKKTPSLDAMRALAAALDVSVDLLIPPRED